MSSSFTIIAIIFLLIFLATMAGMGYIIYYVIKKSTEKKSDEFVRNEKILMENWVKKKKQDLIPWQGHDFTDLGSRMKYTYSKGFSRTLKGTLLDKNNKAVIAFYRVERGLQENGYMFASSTDFNFYFKLLNQSYAVYHNGNFLGTILKSGHIQNAQDENIGFAKHPPKVEFNIPLYTHRSGASYYDFQINQRLLARIEVAPNLQSGMNQNIAFSNENLGAQFIRLVDKNYTQEEEKWLTAMAILEGAVHGYWLI